MAYTDKKVTSVGVPGSSTQYGGANAGGKAKAVLRADLKVDRNNGQGPGAKKNSHMNSK